MKLPRNVSGTTLRGLKPYPETKDSGVEWLGEIPAHWKVLRLKHICRMAYGDALAGDVRQDGAVQVFGSNGRVGFHDAANTEAPCIVIGRKGSFGKVNYSDEPVFAIDTTFLVDSRFSSANLRWLFFFLTWLRLDDGTRDSAVPGLDREGAYQRLGILPPLSEQAAIVRFLVHADRRIRRYIRAKQKLIELLEEERKNATQETTLALNARDCRLETVADLIKRPVNRVDEEEYTPIGLYNRGRGIFKKGPRRGRDLGESDFFWLEEGDLVISGQFAWEGSIAMASADECGCIASHRYPILRGKANVLESGFLLAFLQTGWGQLLLDHHSRGAAGRNRPLNARTLLKEMVPLPPLRSQHRIVEMLRRESRVRRQTTRWMGQLTEYRTRLISDVVSGKFDVRGAAASLPEVDPHTKDDSDVRSVLT